MRKKNVSDLFTIVWRMARDSDFKKMTDEEWERLIENKRAIYEQFKGTDEEQLAHDMCRAVEDYYQRLSHEK